MGKIIIFCQIQLKFCSWLYKKHWHTSCKFQLKKQVIKKVSPKSLWQTYLKWTVAKFPLIPRVDIPVLHDFSIRIPKIFTTWKSNEKFNAIDIRIDLYHTTTIPYILLLHYTPGKNKFCTSTCLTAYIYRYTTYINNTHTTFKRKWILTLSRNERTD